MGPYKSVPVLKERIWGGQKLKQYNKNFESAKVGESWETYQDSMPVLIKLIDANEILSVQVHPNDALAFELEGQKRGKTEAWIVLDCDENAQIVAGLKQGTTLSELKQGIEKGDIQRYLNLKKIKKGDCIYIPAGTVHSLGKGLVVYEVQQPSDLTYRLYDWDRVDEEGISRELHIDKAIKSIDYDIIDVKVSNLYDLKLQAQQEHVIFNNEYFDTSYLCLEVNQKYNCQFSKFAALTIISGSVLICREDEIQLLAKGDSLIIPETCQLKLKAVENAEVVIARCP